MPTKPAPQVIEISVERVAQLFSNLDPFPFPERDLDRDAEEFIVGWARELNPARTITILVHLPFEESTTRDAAQLGESIRRYFAYRAKMLTLDIKELFRVGRRTLAIGAIVLALCVIAAESFSKWLPESTLSGYLRESFIILGWVANWRPIELLLYDWWPVVRRRGLLRRLAVAHVDIKALERPAPS